MLSAMKDFKMSPLQHVANMRILLKSQVHKQQRLFNRTTQVTLYAVALQLAKIKKGLFFVLLQTYFKHIY